MIEHAKGETPGQSPLWISVRERGRVTHAGLRSCVPQQEGIGYQATRFKRKETVQAHPPTEGWEKIGKVEPHDTVMNQKPQSGDEEVISNQKTPCLNPSEKVGR